MITGALILLVGIVIGYTLSLYFKPVSHTLKKIETTVNKVLRLNQAKIIDLSEVDLGENGN